MCRVQAIKGFTGNNQDLELSLEGYLQPIQVGENTLQRCDVFPHLLRDPLQHLIQAETSKLPSRGARHKCDSNQA